MNKRNFYFIFCLFFLLNLLQAVIPGDLNNDGELNVADLVRLEAMIKGDLAKTPEADLNFDGKIDSADLYLLEAALRGDPLPELLAKKKIGSSGGDLSANDNSFILNVPAGAVTKETQIAVSTVNTELLTSYGFENSANAFMISGLPAAENLKIKFKLPPATRAGNNDYSLLMGAYHIPRNADKADWHFQAFNKLEDGVSFENGYLVWTPELVRNEEGNTRSTGETTPENFLFSIEKNWLGQEVYYSSEHFRIQPFIKITNKELSQIQGALTDLENAFQVGIALGFPENKRIENWGNSAQKIKVVIKEPTKERLWGIWSSAEGKEDAWCNPPGTWSAPWLELNTGVISSADRREIVSHEFFHYLQYYYSNNTTTIWLDEMSATWMEGKVSSEGKNYCPSTYKNPRAVINGLYRSSSRLKINHAGFHGYSISAFAYYLSKRFDWKNDFWHKVFSHPSYAQGEGMPALRAAATDMHELGGLGYLYMQFLRNYLSDGLSEEIDPFTTFGNAGASLISLFQETDQNEKDWKRYPQTGKTTILNNTEDLDKTYENEFQIQNLGAATWLFSLNKPKKFYEEGRYMLVEVDEICDDLFITAIIGNKAESITSMKELEFDEENKKRRLILELDSLLDKLPDPEMSIRLGVVASRTLDSHFDTADLRPVNMTVSFPGIIKLPPQTAFFYLWDQVLMEASTDLLLTAEQVGVLGDWNVEDFNPGTSFDGYPTGFRIVYAKTNKEYPQTFTIKANMLPVEHPEVILPGDDTRKYKATTTSNVHLYIEGRASMAADPYRVKDYMVSLNDLAAGYTFTIGNEEGVLPTDVFSLILKPVYTIEPASSTMGENLPALIIFFEPKNH